MRRQPGRRPPHKRPHDAVPAVAKSRARKLARSITSDPTPTVSVTHIDACDIQIEVWTDSNGNGSVDSCESHTLSSPGIASISTLRAVVIIDPGDNLVTLGDCGSDRPTNDDSTYFKELGVHPPRGKIGKRDAGVNVYDRSLNERACLYDGLPGLRSFVGSEYGIGDSLRYFVCRAVKRVHCRKNKEKNLIIYRPE